MGSREDTAMDHADWLDSLDCLGHAIAVAGAGQEAHVLRLFLDLAERVPERALMQGLPLPDRKRIEAALAAGAVESAILILLGEDSGFCLSRGADGAPLASILLPYQFEETTSGGASLGLACLNALVGALTSEMPQPRLNALLEMPAGTMLH
jgi:hypothetical protein